MEWESTMRNDEPEAISIEPFDDDDRVAGRSARSWIRNTAGATAALMGVVALVLGAGVLSSGDDGAPDPERVATDPALAAVHAALAASTSTGGYELSYEFLIRQPEREEMCEVFTADGNPELSPDEPSIVMEPCTFGPNEITITGSGVVHLNPYYLEATSELSNFGTVTIRTDGNNIAQGDIPDPAAPVSGQSLSGYAGTVRSTLGQGPGAFTMLALANNHGYLSLSTDSVTGAEPAGTGEVAGTPVTYYDVISDPAGMLELPDLSVEQRTTIADALRVLDETGFVQNRVRIAVDAGGYIRESWSEMEFADGTTMTRHMILYRFGCIGTSPTPLDPTGMPDELPEDCAPAPTTTTVLPTSTTTAAQGATTSAEVEPSTSTAAQTTTTVADTTTTSADPPTTTEAATTTAP